MEITLRITDDFQSLLLTVAGFILFCVVSYYFGKHYIDRQKWEAEEGQRRIDAMREAQEQEQQENDWQER